MREKDGTKLEVSLSYTQSLAALDDAVLAIKGQMEAVTLPDLDSLVEGEYGILTPDPAKSQVVAPEELDMIVVPGVAFDTRGERLGMGAGFYDAFMAKAVKAKRIALAYSCQLVANIPMEEHDELVHKIITEQGIYNCLL